MMEVYMILYLCIINSLLISALQPACTGSECLDEAGEQGSCTKDGLCGDSADDLEQRQKRETQTAHTVQFLVRVSESAVNLLKMEEILQRLEEYLQQATAVKPQDIFNLTMYYNPALSFSTYIASFILQPETEDVNGILARIESLVAEDTEMMLFGLPFNMHQQSFKTTLTTWDGIKTSVRFELMVEYGWLEHNGLADSNNRVATFLHDRFQIALREIFDLTIMNTNGERTAVIFSIPPKMTRDRSSLLADIESFVVSPCEDTCKLSDSTDTRDECKSCEFVSVFGKNIYPDQQSFQSFSGTWTGNERKFEIAKSERKPCPDHQECIREVSKQELCSNGLCVGIGRCNKDFYKTIFGSIEVYGSIQLLDLYGLDVAIAAIQDSMIDSHGFCRSALSVELFDHGRTKFGLGLRIKPSLGRSESIATLTDMIENNEYIEVSDLTVNKVEDSFSVTVLDPHKPISKYIDNDCFGCSNRQVWCILPNISLCLSKTDCQESQALFLKFAEDTEIVLASIMMSSKAEFVDITEDLKELMKQQIAEQLHCSVELLTNVDMVSSEPELFELGFEIVLLENNKELKNIVIFLQRITDREELQITTNEATFTAVTESLIYKQFISGYAKPKKVKIVSSHFGDAITGGSFLALLILVITVLVKAGRKVQNRGVYQTASINEQIELAEKTPNRRLQIQGMLSRK